MTDPTNSPAHVSWLKFAYLLLLERFRTSTQHDRAQAGVTPPVYFPPPRRAGLRSAACGNPSCIIISTVTCCRSPQSHRYGNPNYSFSYTVHWSNFGVRRAALKQELEQGKQNLVARMGAQTSPTNSLNDWGRHCGSQNVEFPWLQNSARGAAREVVTLLLLAFRKLPRKRSQK